MAYQGQYRPHEAGFSLIEVLAAVAVFGMVSAISAALLTQALRAKDSQEQIQSDLQSIQRVRVLMREDLGQLVLRAHRTPDGPIYNMAFVGDIRGVDPVTRGRNDDRIEVMTFTRRGWANPGHLQPRSSLQRVSYIVEGESLIREAWPYPDAALESEPLRLTLIDGITDLQFEYLNGPRWEEVSRIQLSPNGNHRVLGIPPQAIRMRYTLSGIGEMEHVFQPAFQGLSPGAGGESND